MFEFKYRPDVDGLRAIAVVLVMLFHAGLGFPGGFIGVDVFFVISGFLITGLILKEQRSESFRLSHFWIRRIRRIIPASTFVVMTTLVAGFFVLLPSDYQGLAKSAIAQQSLLSNIYFWRHTGYFAGNAELMPLLHTWSLAVEEQFYIGYPFLLLFLSRFSRRIMVASIVVLTGFSVRRQRMGSTHPSYHNVLSLAYTGVGTACRRHALFRTQTFKIEWLVRQHYELARYRRHYLCGMLL